MALTEAYTAIQPRHTEHDAAAYAAAALLKRSIDPIVYLSQVRSASLLIVILFPPAHPSADSRWSSYARIEVAWSQA